MVRKLIPCQIDIDMTSHVVPYLETFDIMIRLDRLSKVLHVNLSLLVVDEEF